TNPTTTTNQKPQSPNHKPPTTNCGPPTRNRRPPTNEAGIRIANGPPMAITEQQKRMLAIGAMGAGVVLAAQIWRRRDPYEFAGRSVVITGGSRGLGLVLGPAAGAPRAPARPFG